MTCAKGPIGRNIYHLQSLFLKFFLFFDLVYPYVYNLYIFNLTKYIWGSEGTNIYINIFILRGDMQGVFMLNIFYLIDFEFYNK